MESPARQNNGEPVPHGTVGSSTPRAMQRLATNLQQPRLTRTGDGPTRAGDRSESRETQRLHFDPQSPRLTKTGGAHKALQTFHWPNGTAARVNGKREISAGAVLRDETGCE